VSKPRALLAGCTHDTLEACIRMLADEGFAVIPTTDGDDIVEVARVAQPHVIVVDLDPPTVDGLAACGRIRDFTDAYLVMLSSQDSELDKIIGFSFGADDYLTKPYSIREMAVRIRAMRRRLPQPDEQKTQAHGRLIIDPDVREVVLEGRLIELTKIEFDLLEALAAKPRRTLSRAQLLRDIWGDNWYGDDHVIDVHVGNLRRKLGESASAQRHVRTVRGVGYRFEAA
jgi:DNA-binding response OmpR family regulator